MSIFYHKLLDLIQRKGLSKGEFAALAGLSSATMAKLSSHRPVNMDVIDRICEVLHCQPGDIMEHYSISFNDSERDAKKDSE